MTRIIAGRSKGRGLKTPPGLATRPTGARVRQTLFDILAPRIAGCRFLDVCAGTGAVGLEALSRGAARVTLVETDARAVAVIRENLEAVVGSGGESQVYQQDARIALAAIADTGARFDVVFLDPPYDSPLYEELLEQVGETRLVDEDGLVIAEHFHKRVLPETIGRLIRTRSVRIGDHRLTFYRPGTRGEG